MRFGARLPPVTDTSHVPAPQNVCLFPGRLCQTHVAVCQSASAGCHTRTTSGDASLARSGFGTTPVELGDALAVLAQRRVEAPEPRTA